MSLGETLRSRRRQRNLSLEYVSQQTRIQLRFLQALEDENWNIFSARVYLEGFLRRYANFLALDGDELVRELRSIRGTRKTEPAPSEQPAPSERRVSQPPSSPIKVEVLFLIALLGLLAGIYIYKAKPFSLQPAPVPVAPMPSTTEPTATGMHQLQLRAKGTIWVRVWADGQIRFEGTFRPMTTKTWTARNSFQVEGADLSALDFAIDEKSLPTPKPRQRQFIWPSAEEPLIPVAPPLPDGQEPAVTAPPPVRKRPISRPSPTNVPLSTGTTSGVRPALPNGSTSPVNKPSAPQTQ